MTTTLKQLKQMVIRALGDTEQDESNPLAGNVYSSAILLDGCRAALRRISNRLWKNSIYLTEVIGREFVLPDDLIDIQGVFDNKTGMFVPRIEITPGQVLSPSSGSNGWMDFPGNSITFINEIGELGAKIYYMAHWTLPEKDSDVLESPEMCITALVLYAASYCLIRSSVESGDIAQFKTKVDAGKPTDIPAQLLSDWLLRRFESEISSWPLKQRH